MKVTNVKSYPLVAPRLGVSPDKPDHYLPYWKELSAAGVRSKYYCCMVRITTDERITGYGESLVREVPEAHALIIERLLKNIVVGKDPTRVRELWEIMFSSLQTRGHYGGYFVEALSGVDAALWDIVGKIEKAPIYKILGGPTSGRIKAYASSIYWHYLDKSGPEAVAKEAVRLVEAGHDQIKLKIGISKMGGGKDADVKLVKATRDAVGDEVDLMVDANSAFTFDEALKLGRAFEKLGVLWFEEPIPSHDIDGYIKLAKALDIKIAGGESLFSSYTFHDFITKGGFDVAQPNLSRCGGITEYMRIAELCEEHGVMLAPHVGLSGPGARAAAIHAAAATPKKVFLTYEYMYKQDNPLVTQLLAEPLEHFSHGHLGLPRNPGLGMTLNTREMEKFLVRI